MTEKLVLIQAVNQMQEEYLKICDENKVYDEAVKEGVKFEWKTTVEAFLKGKNGRLGSCVLNTP